MVWNINNADQGQAVYFNGINNFAGIENLQGSLNENDEFHLLALGSISGTVDGGAGTGNDSIFNDTAAVFDWTITGLNQGNVAGISNYININNLVGAANTSDNFYLVSGGISGTIDGGTGTGVGSNAIFNQQTVATVWNITGSDQGNVGGIANFINIQDLTGAANVIDEFHLASGGISGSIDGAAGSGDLLINELSAATTWNITGNNQGNINGSSDFIRVENLVGAANVDDIFHWFSGGVSGLLDGGSGTGNDEIINEQIADMTWNITGSNQGNVGGINNFSGIENLTGGILDDNFVFVDGGDISGEIDGDTQVTRDVIDFSAVTSVNVDLETDVFIGIERVIGNDINSSLTAANSVNTWAITGENDGLLNTLEFVDFNNLSGGSLVDTFNLSGSGSVTGLVDAGAGDDVANVNLAVIQTGGFTFNGAADNDSLTISGGNNSVTTQYDNLGGGVERLTYTEATNIFAINFSQTEVVNDNLIANSFFINGSSANDTISLGNNHFNMGGTSLINFTNKADLFVDGLAGNDTINFYENFNLSGGQLTLSAENITHSNNVVLTATMLTLDGVNFVGLLNDSLITDISSLNLLNVNGDVFMSNLSGLSIDQFSNLSGQIALTAENGNIQNAVDINENVDLDLLANTGDISLTNVIQLNRLDLNAENININNGANALALDNVTANSGLNVTATGITVNGNMSSGGPANFDALNSDLILNNNLALLNSASLIANGNNFIQNAAITSQTGNIELIVTDSISMSSAAQTSSASGDVSYSAQNNVRVSSLSAQIGSVSVQSLNGQIVDANSDSVNFTSANLNLTASTGIGNNNGLETRVGSMNVVNTVSGEVDLIQTGEVELIALQNTGSSGDITFASNEDIKFNPGSVVATLGSGNLLMTTSRGSYLGLGIGDLNNPDITAQNASFIGRSGTFGDFNRFLTLDVPGSVLIDTRGSFNPRFVPPGPSSLISEGIDFTVLTAISAVAGEQLVEVESLGEIDPAIFTELKNYSLEEVSIRMPRDQVFEDELEEYERSF